MSYAFFAASLRRSAQRRFMASAMRLRPSGLSLRFFLAFLAATGAATLAFRCEEEMLRDIPDHELEAYNARTIIPLKRKLDSDYMGQATLTSDIALLCQTATCCISGRANTLMVDLSR